MADDTNRDLLVTILANQTALITLYTGLQTMTSQLLTDVQTMQASDAAFKAQLSTFLTTTLPQIIANAVAQANVDDATADQIVNQVNTDVQAEAASLTGATPPPQTPGA